MANPTKSSTFKGVDTLTHQDATRKVIPTAEYQPILSQEQEQPVPVRYDRRNRDLDPQLVWRGKDEQDWSDLVVQAPPLYIQEKIHPKVLIDDLTRQRGLARPGAVHLLRPALWYQVQQQLPMEHHQPRCQGRQQRPHYP